MKNLGIALLLGATALLAPGRSLAQSKPALNTAPPGSAPTPAPAPAPAPTALPGPPQAPPAAPAPAAAPAPTPEPEPAALPAPTNTSPSGLELPGREQARKAAQQHAEQYTKLFIYSGFGLSYSPNINYDGGAFNVSVSPALGYRLTDRIAVGPGFTYAYTSQTFGSGNPTLSLNSYGAKVFAQVRVIDQFLLHAEYEVTKVELPLIDQNQNYIIVNNRFMTGTKRIESPLAGVGYRSQFSNRAAADILLLYNFNDRFNNSLYSNPVLRFNFLFNIGR